MSTAPHDWGNGGVAGTPEGLELVPAATREMTGSVRGWNKGYPRLDCEPHAVVASRNVTPMPQVIRQPVTVPEIALPTVG